MGRRLFSLVLLRRGSAVLLGLKKRGFGQGKWNGFGGKLEKGETPIQSAYRELEEESTLTATGLTQIGIVDFQFEKQEEIMEVHVFEGTDFEGTPMETEEMKPEWYDLENVPYGEMWADDEYWWPYFLRGEKFKAWFLYSARDSSGMERVLDHTISPVESFE